MDVAADIIDVFVVFFVVSEICMATSICFVLVDVVLFDTVVGGDCFIPVFVVGVAVFDIVVVDDLRSVVADRRCACSRRICRLRVVAANRFSEYRHVV